MLVEGQAAAPQGWEPSQIAALAVVSLAGLMASLTKSLLIPVLPSIAADDCVLFLWATNPMLPQAMEVMAAWGFTYKSHITWPKDKVGPGYWTRNKHELLLIGTRGDPPAPAPGEQPGSWIEAPRGEHSEKPDMFRRSSRRTSTASGFTIQGKRSSDQTVKSTYFGSVPGCAARITRPLQAAAVVVPGAIVVASARSKRAGAPGSRLCGCSSTWRSRSAPGCCCR